MTLQYMAAAPEHGASIADLFQRAGSPCYCRWWHFAGDKNAWLDRCANRPDESREEMLAAIAQGSAQMQGVVALDEAGRVVGWMKLAPAESLDKLYAQRLYRGLQVLSGNREGVFTIGCFLVDPAHRRQGVSEALVSVGLDLAKRWGARAVEAFPRRAEGLAPEERWTGPIGALTRAGFEVVHDFAPYPVMRRELS